MPHQPQFFAIVEHLLFAPGLVEPDPSARSTAHQPQFFATANTPPSSLQGATGSTIRSVRLKRVITSPSSSPRPLLLS